MSIEHLRGKFIVIEGTDGAGTTLQTEILTVQLSHAGLPVQRTGEPTRHLQAGRLIRRFLAKELPAPSWDVMALLFAADRLDHCDEIGSLLQQGFTVVSDRYYLSSYIYQSLTSGMNWSASLPWIQTINRHAIVPDHTIVISVPAEVALARRRARSGAEELFETQELQERICRAYSEPHHWTNDPCTVIDGTLTPAGVGDAIAKALGIE